MSQLNIRSAERADVSTILNFIVELATYEKLRHEVVATEVVLEESLFDKKSAEVIIAELDGVPVGFALYFYNFSTFIGKANLYLEDLYVTPEARGQGIGKALLIELGRIAQKEGCARLDWWCLDWNTPSIDFYKEMGAVPMDEWTVFRVTGDALERLAQMEYGKK
ncbi:N-acetyltransferase family protein [Fusibacter sp. JL298sf-3]